MLSREKIKNGKGITLIALVVTIIILLILAGVTINLAINQQGIITRAKQATEMYGNAYVQEEMELDKFGNQIKGEMDALAKKGVIEIEEGDIGFEGIPDDWTKESVTVTATTRLDGYTLQTSKDGTKWETTDKQVFDENGIIYARLIKGSKQSDAVEGEITKIDKRNPSVEFELSGAGNFDSNPTITANIDLSEFTATHSGLTK